MYHNTTTIVLWPSVQDYPGEPVPELQHKKTLKKLKPGLVASYNIQPWNGEGLFWFRRFINLSFTYLIRLLPTYLQLQTHMGHCFNKCAQ